MDLEEDGFFPDATGLAESIYSDISDFKIDLIDNAYALDQYYQQNKIYVLSEHKATDSVGNPVSPDDPKAVYFSLEAIGEKVGFDQTFWTVLSTAMINAGVPHPQDTTPIDKLMCQNVKLLPHIITCMWEIVFELFKGVGETFEA